MKYENWRESFIYNDGEISEPDLGDRDFFTTIDFYTFDQSCSTLSTNSPKFILADLLKISA
jgi:hypothetical protein